jgi:hypothetical protein
MTMIPQADRRAAGYLGIKGDLNVAVIPYG